jgi:2-iminoacetate synthase
MKSAMDFYHELKRYPWDEVEAWIESRTADQVERALRAQPMQLEDFLSLLSPAAGPFLEDMAQLAHRLTEQRFGKVITLFAPLYLSNVCSNRCAYCGFNAGNPVARLTLTPGQVETEARFIHEMGFRHLLLVSGDSPHIVTMDYLCAVLEKLRPLFASISIEIFPLDGDGYREMIDHGVDGLTVFQETYHEERYGDVHLGGKKRDFRWRLGTPERGGAAGFRRLGMGTLLGLCNWRVEGFFLGLHARYLLRTFWKSQVSISFPRLRPAAGAYVPPLPVSDANLVQLLTALRLFLPDAGLVLSTRESPAFRDHLIPLGVTSMSAGSRTEPGGYAHDRDAEAQFEVADERPPEVVAEVIRNKGYDAVWKDWDPAFLHYLKAG